MLSTYGDKNTTKAESSNTAMLRRRLTVETQKPTAKTINIKQISCQYFC
jgi:hypothetical protein